MKNNDVAKDWKENTLYPIIKFLYGKSLPDTKRNGDKFPVYGSNGVVGYHNSFYTKGPGVIVGRKGTIGAVIWSKNDFFPIDTTYFVKIDEKQMDLKWVFYLLKSLNLNRLNSASGTPGLSRAEVYKLRVNFPTIKEQHNIASVITTIDESLENTDQLIDKYKAVKQGLMQDLFRYGIDEKGQIRSEKTHKFKNSPLGRIPEEWEMSELKTYSERIIVGLATSVTAYYRLNGVPIIRNQNIRKGYFDGLDMLYLDEKFANRFPNKACKKDDVLICHTGSNVGDTCLLPEEHVGSQTFTTLIVTTKKNQLLPSYFVEYMNSQSGITEMENILVGGGKNNLNVGQLVHLKIKLPKSLQEQEKIVSIITSMNSTIDKETSYKQKLISIKQGLMNDLLSGNVRVNHLIS